MTTRRACELVIRLLSHAVPGARRDEWRDEWFGELAALFARGGKGAIRFTLGATLHAVAEWREAWRVESLWYDLRHAARYQRKHLVQSIGLAGLIAIGVGANTTVF